MVRWHCHKWSLALLPRGWYTHALHGAPQRTSWYLPGTCHTALRLPERPGTPAGDDTLKPVPLDGQQERSLEEGGGPATLQGVGTRGVRRPVWRQPWGRRGLATASRCQGAGCRCRVCSSAGR